MNSTDTHGSYGARPLEDDTIRLPRDLDELAREAGIQVEWADYLGRPKFVSEASLRRILPALGFPLKTGVDMATEVDPPRSKTGAPTFLTARAGGTIEIPLGIETNATRGVWVLESGDSVEARFTVETPEQRPWRACVSVVDRIGYHQLYLLAGDRWVDLRIAVAPKLAFGMPAGGLWGSAVQVYSLRAPADRLRLGNGVGDYSALASFASAAGSAGCDAVAVSPTHAGFAADPSQFSPYSPSSRLVYNTTFIDPVIEFGQDVAAAGAETAGLTGTLATLANREEIDWEASGAAKALWLRAIYDALSPDADICSDVVGRHALFEVLHAHFLALGLCRWQDWPAGYGNPDSAEVAAFASGHARDVGFHAWLQRLAGNGLARAQAAARTSGMRIGLIADMAIGMSADGSHAWASQTEVLTGLEIGAPPDLLNASGQAWGITTLAPCALRASGFEPFIATLRAAMAHAGGVRIDHILGMRRLWLVPHGEPASEGAFVDYPFDDLLNLIVLESHRSQAIVIGEDLGTVPEGLREVLWERGVYGMSVLWFEKKLDGTGFDDPGAWREGSVAMTTTHDLPTAAGWWAGKDIEWRARLGREPDLGGARETRERERRELQALAPEMAPRSDGIDLAIAAVARSSSPLAIVPVEDLLGLLDQPNFPGTVNEHPNWRRRLPVAVEGLFERSDVVQRIELLRSIRSGGRDRGARTD